MSSPGQIASPPARQARPRLPVHPFSLLLGLAGIVLFVWACATPRLRTVEGAFSGPFCLALSVAAALLLLACAWNERFRIPGLWLALAMAGQAAALQLVDAGPRLHYQHYRPLSILIAQTHPLLLLALLAQAALVTFGLRKHWPALSGWIGRNFRTWQILAAGLIFVLSAATVSRDVKLYLAELVLAALVQTVNLANIILAGLTLRPTALEWLKPRLQKFFGPPQAVSPGFDRFALIAAGWTVLLAAALSFFSYQRHPHIADEVVYLHHARYLAAGMLAMPAPPVPAAFELDLMDYHDGRWFCPVPPAWPAVLALAVLAGVPWLANPLLAGFNVLLAYTLIRELYDRPTARLATLLLAASPWQTFMAMNFMTHTLTLTCALLGALGVARASSTGRLRWACLAGIAAGLVGLIRPLEGLAVAGLLGLWALGVGGRRLKPLSLAAFALAALATGAAVLPYNRLLTGNPARFPIVAYTDKLYGQKSNAYGFGPERGLGWPIDPFPGHGPLDALINADLNAFSINIELFGWSTGSLLLAALPLLLGKLRRPDRLMLAVIAAIFVLHFFYWFSGGPDFGARYWFLMLVPCVALAASGLRLLEATTGSTAPSAFTPAVLALCLLALVNYFPWRAVDKYYQYLDMRPDIPRLAAHHSFGASLVLVRGDRHPDYASAAVYNPIDLQAPAPIYAWDRSPQVRAQILRAYPGRPVWLLDGPSITGGPFRVAAGPLTPAALLQQGAAAGGSR